MEFLELDLVQEPDCLSKDKLKALRKELLSTATNVQVAALYRCERE